MANFGDKASALLVEVQKQQAKLDGEVEQVRQEAERLLEAARKVDESSSGSNFGYHGELFYGDFQRPPLGERFSVEWGGLNGLPHGWRARSPEEVKQRIEEMAGIGSDRVKARAGHFIGEAKELQTQLLIELAPLHNINGFAKEKDLLNGLEKLDWADNAHNEYAARAINSFPRMTRDREAIMQGRILPAHTYYEAVAVQASKQAEAVRQFWRSAERLLKQLQSQMSGIPTPAILPASKAETHATSEREKTAFLVHGRAEGAQQTVARFLEKLELNVIILSEQPNKGRTIIEKFEQHSNVGFAVALLTPDDVGGLAEDPGNLNPRARQNVILELGYFIGKLGRASVCALYVDGVELPSDLHGIGYVSFDAVGGWKLKLATEMRASGMKVDLNKAVS